MAENQAAGAGGIALYWDLVKSAQIMPAIGPLRNGAARRKLRRGDRPPLGPGEIGPNNARNRAMKKRRREAQAAPGDRPPLGPGEIGPNNARNRAMKKRRREAQAAQAAPGDRPPIGTW
ncbi:hypothetical protein N7505_004727 [Penicillium chrysogenum]|uniref:Uncharacterized protein n=1 Tax=Penicillium chrysogenum TaxID=5076 RepID=A0ABQ8WG25_PENCH|nr:hypothetical protein N7505_004727 [Penicillium chrysogenum]